MFNSKFPTIFPLSSEFDKIFEEFSNEIYKTESSGYPKVNMWFDEEGNGYISIACTGIPEKALNAYIDDEGALVVEAQVPKDTRDYVMKSYPIKSFKKRFIVDKRHEIGTIVYENGELIIRLNKKDPVKQEIPIISSNVSDSELEDKKAA
jgi:HSP20 family molecular chaperone IbpA